MKSCSVSDGLAIFKALGSPVRVQILRLIQEREGLNIKQIAQNLKIPVTTLSPHLNLLAEAGLIEFRDESLSHGTQKRCYFIKDWDQLLVNMALGQTDFSTLPDKTLPFLSDSASEPGLPHFLHTPCTHKLLIQRVRKVHPLLQQSARSSQAFCMILQNFH